MELDKRQWYVRWFFWSLMVWDEFKGHGDSSWHYRNGTNLCHFLRVMVVWCPLALLLNGVVYASGIIVLTALPIYFWGGTGYAYIVGAIAIVIGVIMALKTLFRAIDRRAKQRMSASFEPQKPRVEKKQESPKVAAPAPAGPGFFQVLRAYMIGLKQKVCPVITFNHQAQGAVS